VKFTACESQWLNKSNFIKPTVEGLDQEFSAK